MKKIKGMLVMLIVATLIIAGCYVAFDNIKVKPVDNLSLSSSTPDSQTITWSPHNRADYYDIYFSQGANGEFKKLDRVDNSKKLTYTVSNLDSASLYAYQVVAVNEFAKKEYKSAPVSITAYTSPDKITDFYASTDSEKSLTAKWRDNQSVDGYEIFYSENKDFKNATEIDVAAKDVTNNAQQGGMTYLIPNLQEDKTYYLKLRCYLSKQDIKSYSQWCDFISATVTQAVDMTGVDITKPMVALTFDDGPDYGDVTDRILNTLKQYGAKATFFQLGERVEQLPEVSKRIVKIGNELACHTYNHTHYGSDTTKNDIVKGNDAIERVTGHRPRSFRSTGGMTTDGIKDVCSQQNQSLYYWSVDTRDWETKDTQSIINNVESNVSDGDIVLMHNIYSATADAVEQIVPYLVNKGYQLVTVSQLVQAKTGKPPVAGTQYFTATRTD